MKKISKWVIDITEVYPTTEQEHTQKKTSTLVSIIGFTLILFIYFIIK